MRTLRWSVPLLLTLGLALAGTPAVAVQPVDTGVETTLAGVDLERATVLDLQRAMSSHRFSSVLLTAFYVRRIHALNPSLHAVIETNRDALRQAAASDLQRRRHGARSALEGIPVLLKDNVDTADREHSTAGSFALVRSTPARNAFLAQRLRAAGAVILGKANLSEWANFRSLHSSSGWSGRGGQTNNPYVLDRNPCGSSSGSGAAAAANLATVTIGTETDGSIVCPSGANSAVGIKPSLGLVSRSGVVPISAEQDTAGPITRNVTDAAAVLSVIQGVDPRDPATGPAAPFVGRDYLRALDSGALRGARIGVWRAPAADNPEVAAQLEQTVNRVRALGATIVDNITLPGLDQVDANEFPALLTEFKHDINAYLAARPGPHPARRHPRADQQRGLGHRPEQRRRLHRLRRLLDTGRCRRLPEHHGPRRVRPRRAAARRVVLRREVERADADRARLRVRTGDPGPQATAVPAHPARVTVIP